jgi:formate dehydrogenase
LGLAPYLLYESLGATLPDGFASTAAVWGMAQVCATTYPDAVARAGHTDGNALFDAILATPSGVTFTSDEWENVWAYVRRPDRRFTLDIPELTEKLHDLRTAPSTWVTDEFPLVLSAGERRSFTANTIYRDPTWRRRDVQGALRISSQDATALGLTQGDTARVTTATGSATTLVEVTDMMQPGHISLPNGYGLDHPDNHDHGRIGVAPNELTSLRMRDWFAGTPWHKHVPARVEALRHSQERQH